jgi:hypothetical protein
MCAMGGRLAVIGVIVACTWLSGQPAEAHDLPGLAS